MMMKRILSFTVFIVAVTAVVPVLSKGKSAAARVSQGAGRTINRLATLKKRAEVIDIKGGKYEMIHVGSNGYLNRESALNDLRLFWANLWQRITNTVGMKTLPAIGMGDSAFMDKKTVSACGAEISFHKVTRLIQNNDGPGPKVLIELVKVNVYNPEGISSVQGNGKTGASLSLGSDHILTSKSIDTLLDRLSKNAFINLGQVAPAFFDKLTALDSNDKIEVGTLPKLSASNAKPAKISLGRKNYYRKKQQATPVVTASKPVSSKVYELVNNKLSVEFKPDTSIDDELNIGISVTISNSIENPGETPGKPVISKSEANLPFHSGDVIVIGGLGQLENRETPTHNPSYKWVFMGLPKPKSGIISLLFIKPTVIR